MVISPHMTETHPEVEPKKSELFSWDEIPDFFNDEDALSFLLDFAQLDFSTLKRGDWLRLQDDLRRFLGIHPQEAQTLQDYDITPNNLTALQKSLQIC